jgi:ubiquinone/menaquinone biosynthesis C-methylase UbiE
VGNKFDQRNKKPEESVTKIRNQYDELGVQGYYQQSGSEYRNPHEKIIHALLENIVPAWQLNLAHVLDLACGSGEITVALARLGVEKIVGCDPFTAEAYRERTGLQAELFDFTQISAGTLADRSFSLIVCSFALHLCEVSRLPLLCARLAEISPSLLIITPHKRPEIKPEWGWILSQEICHERVRARLYTKVVAKTV